MSDGTSAFRKKKRPQGTSTPNRECAFEEEHIPSTSTLEPELDSTSETLEELIALRKLSRRTGGIDADRLNAGEKKRRKKVEAEGDEAAKGKAREELQESIADDTFGAKKLVKNNNFTGQTNTVDVDKHMMAYIEEELRKRRGNVSDLDADAKPLDPTDELYKLAEKYKEVKVLEEGTATSSAAMLIAIPEVDLGIEVRLRNIEDTEKAKRELFEAKQAAVEEEEVFAADRFYRSRRPHESDSDALAKARREAAAQTVVAKPKVVGAGRRELATDDQVMDRFKKRQRK